MLQRRFIILLDSVHVYKALESLRRERGKNLEHCGLVLGVLEKDLSRE